MNSEQLTHLATSALDDLKGVDIEAIDIRDKTSMADVMLIATGTSMRHVKSLANEVKVQVKAAGNLRLSVEGDDRSDWVLIDLGDVIVHVMTKEKREFYALEKLWSVGPEDAASQDTGESIETASVTS
jgi:ribosome-associated protein